MDGGNLYPAFQSSPGARINFLSWLKNGDSGAAPTKDLMSGTPERVISRRSFFMMAFCCGGYNRGQ
jgi:hypothetical protein